METLLINVNAPILYFHYFGRVEFLLKYEKLRIKIRSN
ncbi:hypothetical protein ABOONEI_1868 [Aciduliprofundum boonei T469]|nr:hypothetical protein ABOONEI_1868 [Aciduliprofundum boonei T469]